MNTQQPNQMLSKGNH